MDQFETWLQTGLSLFGPLKASGFLRTSSGVSEEKDGTSFKENRMDVSLLRAVLTQTACSDAALLFVESSDILFSSEQRFWTGCVLRFKLRCLFCESESWYSAGS